ncbi:MAG TPA: pyrroloquinoline quinone biosynthesis protein PqqE [Chthoniobacter sp.]|nr:pyrroloquinoline quinone biosynthesis protein PqqE [Chthoniobacter sp.]
MTAPRPYALLAEVTYRCPLHCPYCSNPLQQDLGAELTTAEWSRVLEEAAALGVLQVGFSGGEPLARPDLTDLIAAARTAGLFTNVLTSGVGLNTSRLAELRSSGLDSIQLSLQADEADLADSIAGTRAHRIKLDAAKWIKEAGLPLSLNVVLHRHNLDRLPQILNLAEELGAQRLELANTQYYGWALKNRAHLLPTKHQVDTARAVAEAAQKRLAGRMDIFYVLPDYYETRPKPCLAGWGQRYLTINPLGEVLPCPTAFSIPGLAFPNVRQHSLQWIWEESDAFNRFRGTAWMPEPCQSCDRREIDFGGCRCQAALLLGDATATDPVCTLSPRHQVVENIVSNIQASDARPEWEMRTF